MKTKLLSLIIMIAMPLWIAAQTYEQIPFKTIKEIADRNAQALWGDVYVAEPIPYYGFDNEIVAWRFNYSIGKPFPDAELLKNTCRELYEEGNVYQQWGGDDFGQLLIGARDDVPVLIEYSQCLSAEYALGFKIEKLVARKTTGKSAIAMKTHYLNHFNTWYEYEMRGERFYINISPTGGIISQKEFAEMKEKSELRNKGEDFKTQWEDYKNGKTASARADIYIDNHELMPFYDWSYGCSPTAAAMLFAWYDNRSMITPSKYSYLISHHFMRYDTLNSTTYDSHWDYNVSWLQKMLALGMDTDTLTGSTMPWDIDDGMEWAANTLLNYDFDAENKYSSKWTLLKEDINAGKPLLVHINGHSTTGVGYNENTGMVITHYTWGPPNHIVWFSKWDMLMITRVTHGGSRGAAVDLIRPFGDPRYNNTGQGEEYAIGNYAEILWGADNVPGSTIDLIYSLNGGHSFQNIVDATENDGIYDWLIPAGAVSNNCRVMINIKIPEMGNQIAGADGSWSNFKIKDIGAIATMTDGQIYDVEELTKYYYQEHNHSSWAVIGANSDDYTSYCSIQIFDDDEFNQTPLLNSFYAGNTNFVVIDGNHVPSAVRGVKIRPTGTTETKSVQYEGGNDNMTLTPGATTQLNWNNNQIVEMYDIHLTPGQYFIKTKRVSGEVDVDMAFFKSSAGTYFKAISDAEYFSDNWGGLEDSFIVNITAEDDYGLCLFAKTRGTGVISVKIDDAYIWTGAENTNWHDPDNWLAGAIPGPGCDVAIPNTSNDPVISDASANCGKLNLMQGAWLTLNANNLSVHGEMTIDGSLRLMSPTVLVICYSDVMVASHAYFNIDDDASIWVYGDWTFGEGTNPHFDSGIVNFKGTSNSLIFVKSDNAWFYDLKISKTEGASVAYDNCIGIEPLRIKNQFEVYSTAVFVQSAFYDVIFEGPFLSYPGSHFYFQNGTVRFEKEGTGGISIFSGVDSFFNDVVVSVEDWLGLASDIEIRGDLLIEQGMFKTLGYDVYIRGNWNNNSGFNHGNSRVIFNGTGIQEITGTNFWELELNKTAGELRVHESLVSVQHYDWTQGTVRVNGGWFQLNGLEDPGIYGTVILTSGQLDMHQLPDEFLDLNGNLQISGGEMNIYGGDGDSFWPYSANATFTMSDGVLDFKTNGLRIYNSATYSLTESITGGVIKINGDLTVTRNDFNPAGGTFIFYGYIEDATLSVATGSNLFSLEVDKSSKKKAQVKTLTASGTLDLNGDFIIEGGKFKAPTKMYIGGLFVNNQTPAHFDEMTGEVILDGSVNQVFDEDETFYKLTINKPGDGTVTVGSGSALTVLNNMLVDRGYFNLEAGTTLLLDGTFEANYLGNVDFQGEPGNEVNITSATKSNYNFNMSPGGGISATHTVFSNMGANGVHLYSGAYINPDKAFAGCTFTNGAPGGTLITWDNGAEVIVQNAVFPENTTGCTFNVKKTTNSGHVFFDEATGPFSGTAFESDPFSRIDWEYIPPFLIPFTEDWASASLTTNYWVPEGANWQISGTIGNPAPTAFFKYFPRLYNYSVPLRSHLIDGSEFTGISVKFDIRYVNFSSTTLEQLKVQIVHKNGDFITLATYDNSGGTFGFVTKEFDVSAFADGEIFYLRFTAFGEDSWNIDGWYIDNIQVSGILPAPGLLKGLITNLTTGLPVQNAEVTIDGTAFSALSGATGYYSISNIPKGVYSATVTASGYEPLTVGGIEILSGVSTVRNFALEPIPPSYCTENLYSFGCAEGDGFNYFELRDILNASSGCSENGYGDFTLMTTDLPQGYYYHVYFSSGYTNQTVSLWIDFNDDFEFSASERLLSDYILLNAFENYQTDIYIPGNAPTGQHRLRIRSNWDESSSDPCAQYQYGETEDYSITITSGMLTGSIMTTVTSITSGEPVENATIVLIGTEWIGFTEEEGICMLQWITPGSYDILVSADGFESIVINDFYVYGDELTEMEIELNPIPTQTHVINIPAGWSGLSSFIYPEETGIETIFAPVVDHLIIMQNFTGVYWPSEDINTLINWEHHSAYMIKVIEDIELTMTGQAETNHNCPLNSGWTLLPVVCNHNPNTENLFFPELSNLLLAKEIAGVGIYWPAMGINTLPELQTGKAYLVKMQSACSVTFPVNIEKSEIVGNPNNPVSCELWDNPVPSASSHIIAIPESVLVFGNIPDGGFIGAFTTNGTCAGLAEINGTTAITVFADDLLTLTADGFTFGEPMLFRIFKPNTGELLDVEFDFDPTYHNGVFDPMGISVVNGIKEISSTSVCSEMLPPRFYPNPTSGKIIITGVNSPAMIQIHNSQGVEVLHQNSSQPATEIDLTGNPPGVYLVRIFTLSGGFNQKVIVY